MLDDPAPLSQSALQQAQLRCCLAMAMDKIDELNIAL